MSDENQAPTTSTQLFLRAILDLQYVLSQEVSCKVKLKLLVLFKQKPLSNVTLVSCVSCHHCNWAKTSVPSHFEGECTLDG